jgi:alkanesulfonate monooxygenase SsuD/methylene tetrahydromethanopterin reductase-like flavin-dependent oxidoreductase (luciferase family)
MKVVAGVGEDLAQVAEQARRADELGYDALTTGEMSHDSMLIMTLAAEHTRWMEVCSSVTIAYPRSPMVLAMEVWDLQKFTGGRINIAPARR